MPTTVGSRKEVSQMRKKITVAIMALVAVAAIPSVASATEVLDEAGNPFPLHTTRLKTEANTTLELQSSSGPVKCDTTKFEGVLTENGPNIKADIDLAEFKEHSGTPRCAGPGGTWMEVLTDNMPWCLVSTSTTAWTLDGGTCGAAVRPNVEFTFDVWTATSGGSTLTRCRYSLKGTTAHVVGTVNNGVAPATLTFGADTTFERTEGSALFCPAGGTLIGTLQLRDHAGNGLKVT